MHRMIVTAAAVLFFMTPFLFSAEETAVPPSNAVSEKTAPANSEKKNYIVAAGETLFSNAFLFSVNRFIFDTEFSHISLETIKTNFKSKWQWDQSAFQTNQVGHPYQGSTYFAAGRANGLNFYESAVLTSFGSATWELAAERNLPSMNDLIVTTMGGSALGEMFHRLYIEASATGNKASMLVSPMDAFNGAVTRRATEPATGAIKSMSVSPRIGFANAFRDANGYKHQPDGAKTPIGGTGFNLVYGDPFANHSSVPFDQFEMAVTFEGGYLWYASSIRSDGYLFSFCTTDSESRQTTVGMSLQYDFLFTKSIQFCAHALDFTCKNRWIISPELTFSQKFHAGWLTLGAANFYPSDDGSSQADDSMRDYGTGVHSKISLSLEHARYGTLELGSAFYGMVILPGTVENSEGKVICLQLEASYLYPLTKSVSLTLGDVFTREKGWYTEAPDVGLTSNSVTVGACFSLK